MPNKPATKRNKGFCGAKPTQKPGWTERAGPVGHYGFFTRGLRRAEEELAAMSVPSAAERRVQRRRGPINEGRRSAAMALRLAPLSSGQRPSVA
jgi:hypothetical protein